MRRSGELGCGLPSPSGYGSICDLGSRKCERRVLTRPVLKSVNQGMKPWHHATQPSPTAATVSVDPPLDIPAAAYVSTAAQSTTLAVDASVASRGYHASNIALSVLAILA